MSVMTISNKADLQNLTEKYPVVIVAAWDTAVTTGEALEKEIERLTQWEGYNHDKGVFAKFIVQEFNDLVEYLEMASPMIIVTYFHGEKHGTCTTDDVSTWNKTVRDGLRRIIKSRLA